MNSIIYIIISSLLFVKSCSTPSKLTSWTEPYNSQTTFSKILVVGIINDSLIEVRRSVEDYFVQAFKAMGYNAEASLDAFGKKGLTRLDQERTYVKLCNQGIDAVMTIALLNEKKAIKYHDPHARENTSSYFYQRILSYRSIRANPKDHIELPPDQIQFLWEATLFNLSTLSPIYWAQTKAFPPTSTKQNHETYSKIILTNLHKQKVLDRRFASK